MPPATAALPMEARRLSEPVTGPAFAGALSQHGARPALVSTGGVLTYAELDGAVDEAVGRLGRQRRLVVLPATSSRNPAKNSLKARMGNRSAMKEPATEPMRMPGVRARTAAQPTEPRR